MFETSPEIAIICVASGVFLIARGLDALFHKSIKIRKHAGWPLKYDDVTLEQYPGRFRFTAWGSIALGAFFITFPFVVQFVY
jgi:hypothetical protein